MHRCDGIPKDCMLSVRAGYTRRQAPLELGRPLKFPVEAASCDEIQVDILALLGRAKLAIKAVTDRYDVHLEPPSGSNKMSCEMEVRRASSTAVTSAKFAGSKSQSANKRPTTAGTRATGGTTSSRRHEAAMSAQKYMERHGLVLAVQQAMQVTVSHQPDDPIIYMADQLRTLAAEMKSAALEEGASPQVAGETTSQPTSEEKPVEGAGASVPEELPEGDEPPQLPSLRLTSLVSAAGAESGVELDGQSADRSRAEGDGNSAAPHAPGVEPSETVITRDSGGGPGSVATGFLPQPPPSTCGGRTPSLSQADHGTILGEAESEASAQAFAETSFRQALVQANQCLNAEANGARPVAVDAVPGQSPSQGGGGPMSAASLRVPQAPSACGMSASLSQAEHGTILGEAESEASAQAFAEESFRLAMVQAGNSMAAEEAVARKHVQVAINSESGGSVGSGEDCEILVTNPSTHQLGMGINIEDLQAPEAVTSARTEEDSDKGDTEETRFEQGSSGDDGGSPSPARAPPPLPTPPRVVPPLPPVEAPPMLPPPSRGPPSVATCANSSVAASVQMLMEDEEHLATRPAHQAVAYESLRGIMEAECLLAEALGAPPPGVAPSAAAATAPVEGPHFAATVSAMPARLDGAAWAPAPSAAGQSAACARSEATASTLDQHLEDDESIAARRDFQTAARNSLEAIRQAAALEGMSTEEVHALRIRIRAEFEARLARGELKPILQAMLPEEETTSNVGSAAGHSRSCAQASSTVVDECEELDQVRAAVRAGLANAARSTNIENLIFAALSQEFASECPPTIGQQDPVSADGGAAPRAPPA